MLPNKKHLALILVLTIVFSLSAVFADKPSQEELDKLLAAQTDTSQILSPLIDAIEKGRQSVVGVNVYPNPPMGANYTEDDQGLGIGSGTVISPWGHVLTNAHVVEGGGGFAIVSDEKLTQAYLMDVDKDKDIAVLFAPGLKLPHVTFGDSDALKVGEWAIVIGNPMDHSMERTVMIGVISALDRAIESMPQEDKYGLETTTMQTMIQTDAAINPGMSGGGLFNSLGQLQGIPTMKIFEPAAEPGADQGEADNAPVDGIGMCIPIKTALPMIEKVLAAYDGTDKPPQMEDEEIDGPRLGVMLASFDDRFPPRKAKRVPRGLFVEDVDRGSPAAKAGFRPGDILVEVNGELTGTWDELMAVLPTLKELKEAKMIVYRVRGVSDIFYGKNPNARLVDGEYKEFTVVFEDN